MTYMTYRQTVQTYMTCTYRHTVHDIHTYIHTDIHDIHTDSTYIHT